MPDIQLTLRDVAESFGPDLLDESVCRKAVILLTRGKDLRCPACGELFDTRQTERLLNGTSVQCRFCERWSSARTGTILEGSPLSDRQLMFILSMLYWDLPVNHIAAMAGCSKVTVYSWKNRLGMTGE